MSNRLMGMINAIGKQEQTVLGHYKHRNSMGRWHDSYKKRVADRLGNPRLLKITFHKLRHWKATMEYHKTKDILYIMRPLGYRNIQSTLLYAQLISFESDEFHSATAKTVQDAQKLVGAGFQYVCDFGEVKLFRKRK